jgi:hypothetical protein
VVLTPAHCLPHLPEANPWAHTEDRTYPRLVGALGEEGATVTVECYFVDPLERDWGTCELRGIVTDSSNVASLEASSGTAAVRTTRSRSLIAMAVRRRSCARKVKLSTRDRIAAAFLPRCATEPVPDQLRITSSTAGCLPSAAAAVRRAAHLHLASSAYHASLGNGAGHLSLESGQIGAGAYSRVQSAASTAQLNRVEVVASGPIGEDNARE